MLTGATFHVYLCRCKSCIVMLPLNWLPLWGFVQMLPKHRRQVCCIPNRECGYGCVLMCCQWCLLAPEAHLHILPILDEGEDVMSMVGEQAWVLFGVQTVGIKSQSRGCNNSFFTHITLDPKCSGFSHHSLSDTEAPDCCIFIISSKLPIAFKSTLRHRWVQVTSLRICLASCKNLLVVWLLIPRQDKKQHV